MESYITNLEFPEIREIPKSYEVMWGPYNLTKFIYKLVKTPQQPAGGNFSETLIGLNFDIQGWWEVSMLRTGEEIPMTQLPWDDCIFTPRGLRSPSFNDGERRPPGNVHFGACF